MFASLKLATLTLLAITAALASPAANTTADATEGAANGTAVAHAPLIGGFAPTCPSWGGVFDTTAPDHGAALLYAVCRRRDGSEASTSIDLNNCIANFGGNLACGKNGQAFASCQLKNGISTGNTILQATCGNGQGGYSRTSIDVNSCVGNVNGVLTC